MFKAFEKIISLIINKSDADDESNIYQSCPAFNPYIKKKFLTVPASCFKLIKKDKIVAYSGQVHKQTLRLDDIRCHKSLSCNCIEFVKWALCYHVVDTVILRNIIGMALNIDNQIILFEKLRKELTLRKRSQQQVGTKK
jgi:hypothetical protein